MSIQLKVLLEPDLPCYYSGQDVCGRVVVWAGTTISCNAIHVKMKGYCGTDFTKDDDEHHADEEVYFENTITVWSGHDYGLNLMAGEHSFPFQYRLPPNIPSSFEGMSGHVRYEVEAKTDQPWASDQTALARFKVSSTVDLSTEFDERLRFEKEDTICCCCCEEGPFIVDLYADRRGYIPGEEILISGDIKNRTQSDVNSITVTLTQTIRYRAGGSSKKQREKMKVITESGFPAGSDKEWRSVRLKIPETAICLRYCTLITADYTIKVWMDIGFLSSISLEKEVFVGNLPPVSAPELMGGAVGGVVGGVVGDGVVTDVPSPFAPFPSTTTASHPDEPPPSYDSLAPSAFPMPTAPPMGNLPSNNPIQQQPMSIMKQVPGYPEKYMDQDGA